MPDRDSPERSTYQPTQEEAQSQLELGLHHITRAISGVRPNNGTPYTDDEMQSLFSIGDKHASSAVRRANEHGWELDLDATRGQFER